MTSTTSNITISHASGGSPMRVAADRRVPTRLKVGLLALQGDFELHRNMVRGLGHAPTDVRTVAELDRIDALIMPGGESTTMRKLMAGEDWFGALRRFASQRPIFGTCAGLILLGHLQNGQPRETTLGLIDCDVTRNAYGRQYQSFRQVGEIDLGFGARPLEMVLIRAPRITRVGKDVTVLGTLDREPTLVRQGSILAGTFHPELSGDDTVHRYFLTEMTERVSG
jgi:5'-phosphate synthase pdxT subunit